MFLSAYEAWWRWTKAAGRWLGESLPELGSPRRDRHVTFTESATLTDSQSVHERHDDLDRTLTAMQSRLERQIDDRVNEATAKAGERINRLRREAAEAERKWAWRPGLAGVLILLGLALGAYVNVCALAG